MKRKILKILLILILVLVVALITSLGIVYYQVSREAATRIQRGVIQRVIFSESPVYYDDGHTPIGVFFEKTHRKYIHYEDIPKVFIKAIVAAEDKNFFEHPGFDVKAILRAIFANFRAGQTVQGGSTITQQTAKNIFKRERRSYLSKLKELIQALLLERAYTKEEILELYINQFFVTGFGRGLSIASEYFFDKEAKDLDLVEAAFIAGCVKAPYRYNPFTKKSEAGRKEARRLANLRKNYVLSNMHELNFISTEDYLRARDQDVPFRKGKITYRLNVILDYIREQLDTPQFRAILQEQGVDNVATSGISIYTSINKDIQEAALKSLRTHLPQMDVQLNGYCAGRTPDTHDELPGLSPDSPPDGLPFLSRITHVDAQREHGRLVVSWKDGGGIIDYDGYKDMGEAWVKWKEGAGAVFDTKECKAFLGTFHPGDLVAVRLRESEGMPGNPSPRLTLSKIPELEGAVVVLHGGMIKAMVGGFSNRYFNRAADARRQLGSIFKPIVYAAALQLKWNILDPLVNRKDLFRFENTYYVPRPDHPPQSEQVSMAWAGAKSENLATVWLLYHLTDRLTMSEFRQVVDLLGLGRQPGESQSDYRERIRDRYGVVVDREALMEAAFGEAKKEIQSDLIFGGHDKMLKNLKRLSYTVGPAPIESEEPEEPEIQGFSFKRLSQINGNASQRFQELEFFLRTNPQALDPATEKTVSQMLRYFYRTEAEDGPPRIIYTETPEHLHVSLLPLTVGWILEHRSDLNLHNIRIDGLFTSDIIGLLEEDTQKYFRRLNALEPYDLEVLSRIRDFRTLVNVSYVIHLSKEMGISTELAPVLSFPLGPNAITILEAGLAYQTIMTGHVYPLFPGSDSSLVPIITKIVDRDGEVLWEYRPKPRMILSKRVSSLVTEILNKVMETGTGQKAKGEIRVCFSENQHRLDISVPSFGKTGTANRFTNSSFVGFVPGPCKKTGQLDIEAGYVIATYVGYDDNRPMKGNSIAIYGSSGALPLWIDSANSTVNTTGYTRGLQPADLVFGPLEGALPPHLRKVPVSPLTGLPLGSNEKGPEFHRFPQVLTETEDSLNTLKLDRHFEPPEKNRSLHIEAKNE